MKFRVKASLLFVLITAIIGTGCGKAFVPIRQDPEVMGLMNQGATLPYKVTLAPIQETFDRNYYNENIAPEEHGWITEFEQEIQLQDTAALFKEFGLFNEVNAFDGSSVASLSEVLEQAYNNNNDFILKLDLDQHKVSFDGFTGSYYANMAVWFLLTPPSWFIADEIFQSEVNFTLKLIDVYSQQVLFRKPYKGLERRALNDFQRGWKIFGIFRTPNFLQVQNWEKIDRQLTPFALKDAKIQILRAVKTGEINAFVNSEKFKQQVSKRIALCVGVSEYVDRRIPALRSAAGDGQRVHGMLTDAAKGTGINPAFCKLLKNQQASREDILKNLEELAAARCRPADTFLLYFSGYGFTARNAQGATEGYLVPADCEFARIAETAISMAELKTALDRINAGNIILILDCAFSGTQTGRTLPGAIRGANYSFFDTLTANERIRIISSTSPGENAYEEDTLGSGLFTWYLTSGVLDKAGDLNLDKTIHLKEVYQYAQNQIYEISAYKGKRQNPRIYGKGDMAFPFHVPQITVFQEEDDAPVEGAEGETSPATPGTEEDWEIDQLFD